MRVRVEEACGGLQVPSLQGASPGVCPNKLDDVPDATPGEEQPAVSEMGGEGFSLVAPQVPALPLGWHRASREDAGGGDLCRHRLLGKLSRLGDGGGHRVVAAPHARGGGRGMEWREGQLARWAHGTLIGNGLGQVVGGPALLCCGTQHVTRQVGIPPLAGWLTVYLVGL